MYFFPLSLLMMERAPSERRFLNRYQNKLRSIKTGTREIVVAARDFNSLCIEKKSAPFHSVDVSPVKPFDT